MTSSRMPMDIALQIGSSSSRSSRLSCTCSSPSDRSLSPTAFILKGLEYLTLLAALYLPIPRVARHRNVVRWVLIGYTALTIMLWLAIGLRIPAGYIVTADEVVLILLLLLEAAGSALRSLDPGLQSFGARFERRSRLCL